LVRGEGLRGAIRAQAQVEEEHGRMEMGRLVPRSATAEGGKHTIEKLIAGASSTPGVPHPALVGPNEGAVASVTLHHHSRGQPAEANSFLRQYLFACP
jgi:hypothetical protein